MYIGHCSLGLYIRELNGTKLPGMIGDSETMIISSEHAKKPDSSFTPCFPLANNQFFTTPLHEWLQTNIHQSQKLPTLPWHILFPFITWTIWTTRNDAIFSNKHNTPSWLTPLQSYVERVVTHS